VGNSECLLRLPLYFTFTSGCSFFQDGGQLLFAVSVCRVETREEKKERRKREKAEQVAYKLEQVLNNCFSLRIFLNQLNQSLVICASTVHVAYIFAHRIFFKYCTYSISLFTFYLLYIIYLSFFSVLIIRLNPELVLVQFPHLAEPPPSP
jgi:tryptophan-rich sensory protein